MEELCEACKCKEHLYWINFESWHFLTSMESDFSEQLRIPKGFENHLDKQLPALLKTRVGNVWPVRLVNGGNIFFGDGWQKFVKDNSVVERDALAFEYVGDNTFCVLIYEMSSGREKMDPLFSKKQFNNSGGCKVDYGACTCTNAEVSLLEHLAPNETTDMLPRIYQKAALQAPKFESGCKRKKIKSSSFAIPDQTPSKSTPLKCDPSSSKAAEGITEGGRARGRPIGSGRGCGHPLGSGRGRGCRRPLGSRRGRNCGLGESCAPLQTPSRFTRHSFAIAKGKTTEGTDGIESKCEKRKTGNSTGSFCSSKNPNKSFGVIRKQHKESGNAEPEMPYVKAYPFYFQSSRRPVTKAEKQQALDLAQAFKPANPSFQAIMRPTSVTMKFYLTIPISFIKGYSTHFRNRRQTIILCVGGTKTWDVQYMERGVTKGWSKFVMDNNLEEGDVLVFELKEIDKMLAFDVKIFPVVEEIVPLRKIENPCNAIQKRRRINPEGVAVQSGLELRLDSIVHQLSSEGEISEKEEKEDQKEDEEQKHEVCPVIPKENTIEES